MKKKPEYVEGDQAIENFDRALDHVMKVPHSQVKAKLEAEKAAKAEKKAPPKNKR